MVETAIESGLRWGELAELRPRDLDARTRILTVSRVQVELSPRFHPDGGQFMMRDYPKGKKHRRLKLSPQLVAKLTAQPSGTPSARTTCTSPWPASACRRPGSK